MLSQLDHLLRCGVQMRINPGVSWIEPDCEVAVLAPSRSSGLNNLLCGMRCQVFTRRRKSKISFACRLPNKLLKEAGPFEPPMPTQFGIERSYNNWIESQFADFANLLAALFQKVTRMFRRCIFRCRPIIQLFLITALQTWRLVSGSRANAAGPAGV